MVSSSSSGKRKTIPSFSETFDKACPAFMAMGMTYHEFWDGDVEIAKFTKGAYQKRVDEQNYMLWLQGLYIYDALTAVMPPLSIKSKEKQIRPYMENPIPLTRDAKKQTEETKQKEKFDRNIMFMQRFMAEHNSAMKDKEKKEEG